MKSSLCFKCWSMEIIDKVLPNWNLVKIEWTPRLVNCQFRVLMAICSSPIDTIQGEIFENYSRYIIFRRAYQRSCPYLMPKFFNFNLILLLKWNLKNKNNCSALECQTWYSYKWSLKIQYLADFKCKAYEINYIKF
jgi:hypothetical protein